MAAGEDRQTGTVALVALMRAGFLSDRRIETGCVPKIPNMKTIDFVYAGIIVTVAIIAIIAFRAAIKNDAIAKEEDNSDLSDIDFKDDFEQCERPWVGEPFEYN